MKTSQKGIDLIKEFEGFESEAYLDPVGVWTIGYGHTKTATPGQTITKAEAEALLREELKEYEGYVNQMVTSNLTQEQFDALVSWTYNLGPGNLQNSTLLKKVNDNPSDSTIFQLQGLEAFDRDTMNWSEYAKNEFEKWSNAGESWLYGLYRRRLAEAELYGQGVKKKD